VYVPTIDRVVLFGGYQPGFTSLYNDTWAYDYNANRWTNLNPPNPPAPRAYHYMAFEPRTNRIVMFGGILEPSDLPDETTINETWIYSVSENTWSQVFPTGAPNPRAWHVMSGTNGSVVLFGGGDSRVTYTNDTFLYSSRSNRWAHVPGENAAATAAMTTTWPNLSTVRVTSGRRAVGEGPTPRQ
jgi:N-acetylneuraminic acid mutarotase